MSVGGHSIGYRYFFFNSDIGLAVSSGILTDGILWELNDEGVITISVTLPGMLTNITASTSPNNYIGTGDVIACIALERDSNSNQIIDGVYAMTADNKEDNEIDINDYQGIVKQH